MKKLERYLIEAKKHIDMINDARNELAFEKISLETFKRFSKIQLFSCEVIIFRFAKLQDLIGNKLFRSFLYYDGYIVQDKSYFEILKEIENSGIIDIDRWTILRKVRNSISHEYPEDESEKIEHLNMILKEIDYLFEIVENIKRKYEINRG